MSADLNFENLERLSDLVDLSRCLLELLRDPNLPVGEDVLGFLCFVFDAEIPELVLERCFRYDFKRELEWTEVKF
jgi:hypothetical protein